MDQVIDANLKQQTESSQDTKRGVQPPKPIPGIAYHYTKPSMPSLLPATTRVGLALPAKSPVTKHKAGQINQGTVSHRTDPHRTDPSRNKKLPGLAEQNNLPTIVMPTQSFRSYPQTTLHLGLSVGNSASKDSSSSRSRGLIGIGSVSHPLLRVDPHLVQQPKESDYLKDIRLRINALSKVTPRVQGHSPKMSTSQETTSLQQRLCMQPKTHPNMWPPCPHRHVRRFLLNRQREIICGDHLPSKPYLMGSEKLWQLQGSTFEEQSLLDSKAERANKSQGTVMADGSIRWHSLGIKVQMG